MLNILVIDDDRDVAESLAEYLRLDGHRVDVAFSGESGREAAHAGGFDRVLIDVGLPDVSGPAVARDLLALDSPPRILLMSGHSAQHLDPMLDGLELVTMLLKPLDLEDLDARLAAGED